MTKSNKPSHIVSAVRNYKKADGTDDSFWTEIGVGFAHKDGKGFSLKLNMLPLDPDLAIQVRVNEPKEARNDQANE